MFVWFLLNLDFLDRFLKNTQISNFTKICPAGAKLLCTDRWTDMMKFIVAFCYFANMLKNDMWHIPTHDLLPQNNWLKRGDISPRLETIWQQQFEWNIHVMTKYIHQSATNSNFCNEEGNAIKPEIIQDYNKYTCYVGAVDRMVDSYLTQCHTRKQNFFFNFLDNSKQLPPREWMWNQNDLHRLLTFCCVELDWKDRDSTSPMSTPGKTLSFTETTAWSKIQ
jgi:hypothetical protein